MRSKLKKNSLFLFIVLATFFMFSSVALASGGAMDIVVSNLEVSADADYLISFSVGQNQTVADTVYFKMLRETQPVPMDVSNVQAAVYDTVYGWQDCDLDKGMVAITVPDSINWDTSNPVQFKLSNVSNPFEPGEYTFEADVSVVDSAYPDMPYLMPFTGNVTFTAPAVQIQISPAPIKTTAGVPIPVTFTLVDQSGVDHTTRTIDTTVSCHAVVDGIEGSEKVKFYSNLESDGTVSGEIFDITIAAGEEYKTVYYYSEQANGYYDSSNNWNWWSETKLVPNGLLGVNDGARLRVAPASPAKLVLDIDHKQAFKQTLIKTDNNSEVKVQLPGAEDYPANSWQITPDSKYQLTIGLQDKFGNPAPALTDVLVNMVIPGDLGIVLKDGDFYPTTMSIPAGSMERTVSLFASEAGKTGVIKADPADPLIEEAYSEQITITKQATDIAIYSQNILMMLGPVDEGWQLGAFKTFPNWNRKVIVGLMDDLGRPVSADQDITVELITTEGAFWSEGQSVTQIVIPAGYCGRMLQYSRTGSDSADLITATPVTATTPSLNPGSVNVELLPAMITLITNGWNLISTPVELERSRFDDVILNADQVEVAYSFDSTLKQYHLIYKDSQGVWRVKGVSGEPEFRFTPMEAIYVKMNAPSIVCYYPEDGVTQFAQKTLKPGWNLIGPSLDISNTVLIDLISPVHMPVNFFLDEVNGKCVKAVSEGIGLLGPLTQWSYVPWQGVQQGGIVANLGLLQIFLPNLDILESYLPNGSVVAGRGIWVYMSEEATLTGWGKTPVQTMLDWGDNILESLSSIGIDLQLGLGIF